MAPRRRAPHVQDNPSVHSLAHGQTPQVPEAGQLLIEKAGDGAELDSPLLVAWLRRNHRTQTLLGLHSGALGLRDSGTWSGAPWVRTRGFGTCCRTRT